MKKEYPRDRSTMLHLQIIQVIRFSFHLEENDLITDIIKTNDSTEMV